MKRILSRLTVAMLLAVAGAAHSAVVYQFSFNGLSGVSTGSGADFSITLTYDNYVTTTGMQALAVTDTGSQASLGYPVAFAGTNNQGWWGFDDSLGSFISDFSYSYGGTSFLFTPTVNPGGYFSAPGVYAGRVAGNAPGAFDGSATLTIRETGAVPVPASVSLVLLGLAGVAAARAGRRG
jgi:hypothetical protein